MGPMHHERKSFIVDGPVLEPADQGWRGTLNKVRLRLDAGSDELMWREDVNPVAQHGPGQRVIAIANGKGSAHKTPTAVMLVAVFARLGDAEILAWDNNEARVSLAWRGVQSSPTTRQRFWTYSSRPRCCFALAHSRRKCPTTRIIIPKVNSTSCTRINQSIDDEHDVDAIHRVAGKHYYRMIRMDSGNNERAVSWRAMIEHTHSLSCRARTLRTLTKPAHACSKPRMVDPIVAGVYHLCSFWLV